MASYKEKEKEVVGQLNLLYWNTIYHIANEITELVSHLSTDKVSRLLHQLNLKHIGLGQSHDQPFSDEEKIKMARNSFIDSSFQKFEDISIFECRDVNWHDKYRYQLIVNEKPEFIIEQLNRMIDLKVFW